MGNNGVFQGEPLSLRKKVYDYLKTSLNEGKIKPGVFLDLKGIGDKLKLSRTPLRDALIQLEVEGFITIHARRGVVLNPIDLTGIRNAYQIIGALEASALLEARHSMSSLAIDSMESYTEKMISSLAQDNFSLYYQQNIAFHDTYLDLSANSYLKETVRRFKEKLYDFPRRSSYLKTWEESSAREHKELISCLRGDKWDEALTLVRDVHWSFSAQEKFIHEYYFAGM